MKKNFIYKQNKNKLVLHILEYKHERIALRINLHVY